MERKKYGRGQNARLELRIPEDLKAKWMEFCEKKGVYMSDYIVSVIEKTVSKNDKKTMLNFIEKQGSIFAKIENNINQIARKVNAEKSMNEDLMKAYIDLLRTVSSLKAEQNDLIRKAVKLMSK